MERNSSNTEDSAPPEAAPDKSKVQRLSMTVEKKEGLQPRTKCSLLALLIAIVVAVALVSILATQLMGKEDAAASIIDCKNDDTDAVAGDIDSLFGDYEPEKFPSACYMLLVVGSRLLIPTKLSGDLNDVDGAIFGEKISVTVPHQTRRSTRVVAGIDPITGTIAYAFGKDEDNVFVVWQDRQKAQSVAVEIPAYPHAIHVWDKAVYLGIGPTVGWISFDAKEPVYEQLVERNQSYKAYDLFARQADFLVAVDDVYSPYYADSFRLLGNHHTPVQENDWFLGAHVNLWILSAAVRDDSLLLLGRYHACHGYCWGQYLYKFNMTQLSSSNGTNFRDSVVLEEEDGAEYGSENIEPNLDWNGFTIQGDELAIASGDRGILVVPTDFQIDSAKQISQLDGHVSAVKTCGAVSWALVKSPDMDHDHLHTLVKLDDKWCKVTSVRIPINTGDDVSVLLV